MVWQAAKMQGSDRAALSMGTNLTLRALINSEIYVCLQEAVGATPMINMLKNCLKASAFFGFVSNVNCVEGCAKG